GGKGGDEPRARAVFGHLAREHGLGELFAEAVVKIAVVKGQAFEREARVLEDVAAAPATRESESPRLALVVIADLDDLRQLSVLAKGAVGARRLEKRVGAPGEERGIDGTKIGRAD